VQKIWKILIISVLLSAMAFVLRTQLIEPDEFGRLCTGRAAPGWCLVRQWLVAGFAHNYFGYVSLLAVVAALAFGIQGLAWLALAAGIFGCTMYRFEPSGAGVLLAALLLARSGSSATSIATDPKYGGAEE
jgi:hypothetical protein